MNTLNQALKTLRKGHQYGVQGGDYFQFPKDEDITKMQGNFKLVQIDYWGYGYDKLVKVVLHYSNGESHTIEASRES